MRGRRCSGDSSRSLQAEFAIFAADGSTIAVVSDVRFRSVRLSRNAADQLRCLAYHATPRPHPLTPLPARASLTSVRAALSDLVRRAALKGSHRRYSEEVDPLLDSLCSRFSRLALQALSPDGQSLPAAGPPRLPGRHPGARTVSGATAVAGRGRSLSGRTADGWEIVPDQRDQSSAQDIWNSLVADDPDYFQIVHSVGLVGMHLGELLAGQRTLREICPQESSLATLLRQVLGSNGKQKIGQALRELIGQGLQDLPAGRRLGIVEISAGAPSFVMDACTALDFNRADYCFATTSASTLDEVAGQTQGVLRQPSPRSSLAATRKPLAMAGGAGKLRTGHRRA
jgi:phthiocerol/phenolphthiocerol synthesis type-I polyketide synthase C